MVVAADGQTLVRPTSRPEVTANWNAPTVPARSAAPAVEVRLDQPLAVPPTRAEVRGARAVGIQRTGRRAANLLGLSRKGLFLKRRRWGLVGD